MTETIPALLKSAVITVGDGRGFVVEGTFSRYIIAAAKSLPASNASDEYQPEENEKRDRLRDRLANRVLTVIADTLEAINEAGRPARPPERRAGHPWGNTPCPMLLGALGEKPEVSAVCFFFDPINDLAILGSPSDYDHKQGEAYEAFTNSVSPLQISDADKWSKVTNAEWEEAEAPAWLLSLSGDLISCRAEYLACFFTNACARPGKLVLRFDEIPRHDGFPPNPDTVGEHFGHNLAGMFGSPVVAADGSAIGIFTGYGYAPRLAQCLPGWLLHGLSRGRRE